MHIETVNLLDGDYELVPADTATLESASLNYTNLNQDLGQVPEEPRLTVLKKASPGAFKSYYFRLFIHVYICVVIIYFFAHLCFQALFATIDACFLGSAVMFTPFTSTRCMVIGPVKVE
jgi:hypothetical protein